MLSTLLTLSLVLAASAAVGLLLAREIRNMNFKTGPQPIRVRVDQYPTRKQRRR